MIAILLFLIASAAPAAQPPRLVNDDGTDAVLRASLAARHPTVARDLTEKLLAWRRSPPVLEKQ